MQEQSKQELARGILAAFHASSEAGHSAAGIEEAVEMVVEDTDLRPLISLLLNQSVENSTLWAFRVLGMHGFSKQQAAA